MPFGAQILCPEKARKSQPICCTSTGQCPALCTASTSVLMPGLRSAPRVDEFGRSRAGGFERRCRSIAQFMDAAMDVSIVAFIVIPERVKDQARFLARRGIVEINQRITVDFLMEDGKVRTQFLPIDHV